MYSSLYLAENITLIVGAMVCPLLLGRFNKRDLSLPAVSSQSSATCCSCLTR